MEAPRDAAAPRERSSARGRVMVRRVGPHRLSVTLVGSLVEDDAVFLADWLDEMLPTCEHASIDFELDELDSYVTSVRTLAQDVLRRHHDRWNSVVTLVRSRITVMGVTVANLALGGRVHAFTDRVEYEKAIAAAERRSPRSNP